MTNQKATIGSPPPSVVGGCHMSSLISAIKELFFESRIVLPGNLYEILVDICIKDSEALHSQYGIMPSHIARQIEYGFEILV
jgi:hypothetical protein